MLRIAERTFHSRLLLGSGKFSGPEVLAQTVQASGSELVTLAMKRVERVVAQDQTLRVLQQLGVDLLPNTSGAKTAEEAILAARLAREIFATNWLKLEIHPDPRYLLPDPIETLKAAQTLVKEGFVVLPYCPADPVLCLRLQEVGCAAVMPLGAPIGSNLGIQTKDLLAIVIEQCEVPVIVDAGIGAPSHAAQALELGADGVLVNTAIASAQNPVAMAEAFKLTVAGAALARQAKLADARREACASSPLTGFLEGV